MYAFCLLFEMLSVQRYTPQSQIVKQPLEQQHAVPEL